MDKRQSRIRRKKGIRKQISGTAEVPRLTVFRSNKHIYAQIIDDVTATTLVSASDVASKTGTPVEKADKVGTDIANKANKTNINKVVFDRNGYRYHGRVKALADAARKAGLQF